LCAAVQHIADRQDSPGNHPIAAPADPEIRQKAFDLINEVMSARGEMSAEDKKRMGEVARLFGVADDESAGPSPFRQISKERWAKVS
jgi:hypothetical protein